MRGDKRESVLYWIGFYFYSRPCVRGDDMIDKKRKEEILYFYSRPCVRGDAANSSGVCGHEDFYSRPCVRGDERHQNGQQHIQQFLLAPLREGRLIKTYTNPGEVVLISTRAPA